MEKKKVLFLINTLRDGGAEKVLVDILNHIDLERFDVELKLITKRGAFLSRLRPEIKLSWIHRENSPVWGRIVSRLLPRLSSETLHKLFVHGKYDTEVAFLEGYATKIIAGAPKEVRKIAWVHADLEINDWIAPVFPNHQKHRDCYDKFDRIVCVSDGVKVAFGRKYGATDTMLTIYNPVDRDTILKKAIEPCPVERNEQVPLFLAIGRLVEQKSFMRLLHAVKVLCDDGLRFHLNILGKGPDRSMLEKYIEENDLSSTVSLLGFQPNPYCFMKQADWLVCSSLAEGFSTVATEATVLGLPTVTTDCAGMKELFGENEYGIIVENSEQGLMEGMRRVLCHAELREQYAKAATLRGERFTFKETLNDIENMLY